ncbi:probable ribose-5-phosphate isomerase 3, chloroplastic, partial [Phalaenopsis equestris]|uniref:probable ribose-5-phosphate isomerase 3, chloroplastic n=1 Tax=Phalaenopsis equestris TaxID=78828 RepID=UPI0009E5F7D9
VDPNLNLVKGRGGALLREKMVEAASDKFVVVIDDSKLVTSLGGTGQAVPVEIVQFCWKYNQSRLQELFKDEGCEAKLRLDPDGKPFVSDNSNYIVDLYFKTPIQDLNAAGKEMSALEGVVEHGLFLDMADEVIISGKEGLSMKTKIFKWSTFNVINHLRQLSLFLSANGDCKNSECCKLQNSWLPLAAGVEEWLESRGGLLACRKLPVAALLAWKGAAGSLADDKKVGGAPGSLHGALREVCRAAACCTMEFDCCFCR